MTLRSWGRLSLVTVCAIVFQLTVLDELKIHGAHPDVMLLVAIGAGLAAGSQQGAVADFAVGLVADLFVDTPFGMSALTFVLVAFCVGLAPTGPAERLSPATRFATAVLASAGGTLLFAGIGYILGEPQILRANIVAVVAVVTLGGAVMAIPVLGAVSWALAPGRRQRSESPASTVRSAL
jgi:rod shape-determining protein MreD